MGLLVILIHVAIEVMTSLKYSFSPISDHSEACVIAGSPLNALESDFGFHPISPPKFANCGFQFPPKLQDFLVYDIKRLWQGDLTMPKHTKRYIERPANQLQHPLTLYVHSSSARV